MIKSILIFSLAISITAAPGIKREASPATLLKNVTLIDGNGNRPVEQTNILIQGETIAAIGKNLQAGNAQIVDLTGKTVMPAMISTHVHIGSLKGTNTDASNYTRDNILSQLKKYENYGVENILVMGTDRPMLFESGLRDSSVKSLLPGARIHSAGYGFNIPLNGPSGTDKLFRPKSPSEVKAQINTEANLKPDVVKMWVDDFAGSSPKMAPEIYKAIISEAHSHGLRAAAHLYYLSDARKLVAAGLDIIAHSIRDSIVDDAFLQQMKSRKVLYIPTLSVDEYAYIYARKPEWINDEFFKAALEPGVYEMISSEKYQNDIKNSPLYARNVKGFEIALQNLKKIFDAGIPVSLGTDSGAFPVRVQGFSEHLELELMVQAGLSPLQAITVATKNAARLLKIDSHYGTIEKGKIADLIILSDNPEKNIRNTRKIEAVYKAGKQVSQGPLAH